MAMFIASIFAVSAWAQQDYTSAIKNADLSTTEAWNASETKGISGGMVKVGGNTFDFCQTITLPAGQYKMTAQAAYRYANSTKPEEEYEYNQIQAGVETHLAKLYAETSSYKYEANVQNRWEGASMTDYTGGAEKTTKIGDLYVPNASNAVKIWFENGKYVNELVFNVQEEGAVKIGIVKTENCPDGDYTNIGAWTLTRLGDAEADPKEEEPTPEPEEPGDDTEETIPVDVTNKVATSKDAWHATGGPVTIDGISMPEKYETTTATLGDMLWQEVTGLENGKYTVELWANARYTPGRGFNSDAADGALDFTYLYANNVEISIEVYHNSGLNNGKSYKLEGVEVTNGTLKMGMTKKAAGSNWHTIQIKSLTYHAPANAALNMAKEELKAALDAANAVSPKADDFVAAIAVAQTVYDSSKSADEVNAAVATLKEATKLAILGNASEESPVLTDFVVNGTFDSSKDPWKSTTGAQNQALASNQQGAFTGNFFENWNPSAVTGKIYQVIENIPNGVYELSICAFVNNFNASVQFVYANADKVALTAGAPTAYTVRTIVENNTIEIGFEQTQAVANWMGIDNVSLTYFGEASNDLLLNAAKDAFTAAYEEFGLAFTACQAMMLKMSFYEVDDAAYQLNEQLETTKDVDALNAMVVQLKEATASLNEINEVYAEYDVFVQKFKEAAEISEPKTTEAAELLEYNMLGGAGMQAASLEALAQAAESIKSEYLTYVSNSNLLEGGKFDLTYLIQNPNIDHNLDGWTLTGKVGRLNNNGFNGVPGIMEIGEWGATSWEAGVSQNLNELPNGKYIVKMAWMAASGIKMNLSANEASVEVVGIGDQGGNIAADGSVVEMGKGVQGWQYAEVEGEVILGTLTIKVTSSAQAEHMWSNADAFQLYYVGAVEAATEAQKAEFAAALAEAESHVLGFAKDEYAPYTNLEAVKALHDAQAFNLENASAKGVELVLPALKAAVWTANTEDMSIIYNGNFAVVTPDANYPLGWTRTNGWGAMQAYVTGCDNGTAYYNQPGSLVYGSTGAYLMPLKANAIYKLTFKYRSHEEGSNKGVVATVALGENSIEVCKAEANPSKDNWEVGEGEFETTEAGNYILTLANSGNTWMTDVVLVQVAGDETGVSAPAMQNVETIIYDLQGRRVQKMEKGLYIVNGKKVLVK